MAFLVLGFIGLTLGSNITNMTELFPSASPTLEPTMATISPTQSPTMLPYDLTQILQIQALYTFTAIIEFDNNTFIDESISISNSFVRSLKDIYEYFINPMDRRLIEFQRRMIAVNSTILYDTTLNVTITDGYSNITDNITTLNNILTTYIETNDEFTEEIKMDATKQLNNDLNLTVVGLSVTGLNVSDVVFVDTMEEEKEEDDEFSQKPVPLVIIVSVVLVVIIIIVVYLCYADNKKSNNDDNTPNEQRQAFTPVKQKSEDGKEEEALSNAVELGDVKKNDDDAKDDDAKDENKNNDDNNVESDANNNQTDTTTNANETDPATNTNEPVEPDTTTTTDTNNNNNTTTTDEQTTTNAGD